MGAIIFLYSVVVVLALPFLVSGGIYLALAVPNMNCCEHACLVKKPVVLGSENDAHFLVVSEGNNTFSAVEATKQIKKKVGTGENMRLTNQEFGISRTLVDAINANETRVLVPIDDYAKGYHNQFCLGVD